MLALAVLRGAKAQPLPLTAWTLCLSPRKRQQPELVVPVPRTGVTSAVPCLLLPRRVAWHKAWAVLSIAEPGLHQLNSLSSCRRKSQLMVGEVFRD